MTAFFNDLCSVKADSNTAHDRRRRDFWVCGFSYIYIYIYIFFFFLLVFLVLLRMGFLVFDFFFVQFFFLRSENLSMKLLGF